MMQRRQSGTHLSHPNRSFPLQLFAMLDQVEADGMSHIVSWRPHGRAFKVHRKDLFMQIVVLRWFRHSNYSSFQRQLNIYGFRRFPEGHDKDSYYHENFVRGQYEETLRIERHAVKGTNVRRSSNLSSFPDFYQEQYHRRNDPSHTITPRSINSSHGPVPDVLSTTQPRVQNSPYPDDIATTQYRSNEVASDLFSNQDISSRQDFALGAALLLSSRYTDASQQSIFTQTSNMTINDLLTELSRVPVAPLARTEFPRLDLIRAEDLLFQRGGVQSNQPSQLSCVVRAKALLDTLRQLQQQQQNRMDVQMPQLPSVHMNIQPNNISTSPEILELIRQGLLDPRFQRI